MSEPKRSTLSKDRGEVARLSWRLRATVIAKEKLPRIHTKKEETGPESHHTGKRAECKPSPGSSRSENVSRRLYLHIKAPAQKKMNEKKDSRSSSLKNTTGIPPSLHIEQN
ncbi:hypothetical protein RB195_013175 [Necator americanus]|uniref:Uncharacterized protein n=1 Tax=Necator americanus TaxID=51031 RepID=A0ABR1DVJ0_NECAM